MKNVRDYILLSINGKTHKVSAKHAFLNLAEYLRYQAAQTGTKIVCAEGDCGACTVMIANSHDPLPQLKTINSCIQPMFNLDGCVVLTVEALQKGNALSSVQKSMVENQGAQCGYCTPGICMSLSYLHDRSIENKTAITSQRAKNFLTGNLCRCTGYEPILKAACNINLQVSETLSQRFLLGPEFDALKKETSTDLSIINDEACEETPVRVSVPASQEELLALLGHGRLIAGGTDLGVQRNKGRLRESHFISLQKQSNMKSVQVFNDQVRVGAGATWDLIQDAVRQDFPEFADSINLFASPQIKHVGTLAGNVMNASPIADGIPFLMVNEAELVLLKADGSERRVPVNEFYQGYKKTAMAPDEVLSEIILPKTSLRQKIEKVSQRRDLDIATINIAIAYRLQEGVLSELRVAFGGVAETTIRLKEAELMAIGQRPDRKLGKEIAKVIERCLKPLTDVRGSSEYRMNLAKNLVFKWIESLERPSQDGLGCSEVQP